MTLPNWSMKGSLIGACNCDWGCPCSFDAYPTKGFCEGSYTLVIKEGRFGDVDLGGLTIVWGGKAPGAIHEGNVTSVFLIDDRSNEAQREAITTLVKGGGVGSPFDIFASVTTTLIGPLFAPIEVKLDGIRSEVKVDGGKMWEVGVTRIKNPVTGDEEEIYLDKPTGFTSKRSELGMSTVARMNAGGMTFDHSGQYGEYAEFEYSGP